MKTLAAILLFTSLAVNAQALRDLKDVMSDMGASLKSISLSLAQGTINAKTISDSDKLIALIKESTPITPDTVLSLPNVDQAAAKDKYVQEMVDLEKTATDFNAALKANDLNTAKTLLLKLGDIKKQGHKDFK